MSRGGARWKAPNISVGAVVFHRRLYRVDASHLRRHRAPLEAIGKRAATSSLIAHEIAITRCQSKWRRPEPRPADAASTYRNERRCRNGR